MRRANTNWGDTWQSVMKMKWDPPDQFAGDYMGLWLSDYYRNPKNQNTPLSSAYKEYFDSQSGKRVCNNEEVCKKAGYYWYDDQCYEEKKEISEEEPPLKDYFDKCQPIKETMVMGENIDMKVLHEIKGEVEGKCEIYMKVVEDNTGYGFEGKEMACLIPMTIITEGTTLSDDNVRTYCTGSLIDAINNLTGGEME
jgi:hypothetical protein